MGERISHKLGHALDCRHNSVMLLGLVAAQIGLVGIATNDQACADTDASCDRLEFMGVAVLIFVEDNERIVERHTAQETRRMELNLLRRLKRLEGPFRAQFINKIDVGEHIRLEFSFRISGQEPNRPRLDGAPDQNNALNQVRLKALQSEGKSQVGFTGSRRPLKHEERRILMKDLLLLPCQIRV